VTTSSRVPDGSLVSDYDYDLPPEQIAAYPAAQRDGSRLLVMPTEGPLRHSHFADVVALFEPGDCLVVNESKVFPARLLGRKPTGAEAEIFLVRPAADGSDEFLWEALVRPGRKLRPGRTVVVAEDLKVEILDSTEEGNRIVRLVTDLALDVALSRYGEVPLPPYISRKTEPLDRDRYQTVYARERGSVAAPTAGLHFTHELLGDLERMGVRRASVTLHIGVGTFRPVDVEDPANHVMHSESYSVSEENAEVINATRSRGGRVWAVGTTAVRTVETASDSGGRVSASSGDTRLFLRPPARLKVVEGLITNFHLPRSTLMMLVAALGGYERTMSSYHEAVAEGYRFYSYGDAMVIPPLRPSSLLRG
jgi:S-adenosylmethionine:tRNA ribosyltransferase-isomerase